MPSDLMKKAMEALRKKNELDMRIAHEKEREAHKEDDVRLEDVLPPLIAEIMVKVISEDKRLKGLVVKTERVSRLHIAEEQVVTVKDKAGSHWVSFKFHKNMVFVGSTKIIPDKIDVNNPEFDKIVELAAKSAFAIRLHMEEGYKNRNG